MDSDPIVYTEDQSNDPYFISVRMLIYQLLHNKATRSDPPIPVIVLVTAVTPDSKRYQLEADGAFIVEAESLSNDINLQWLKPSRDRWIRALDRLHAFKLVQFDKILLLDADMVLVKRIDGVFNSPESDVMQSLGIITPARIEESGATPTPTRYLLAANSGPYGNHTYPAARGTRFSPSFLLLSPSIDMYAHYLSVAKVADSFSPGAPDTNLLNHIHRSDGNMPWKQLDPDWTVNSPTFSDYQHGIRSLHEKWWRVEHDLDLREIFLDIRWRMEGHWLAREST